MDAMQGLLSDSRRTSIRGSAWSVMDDVQSELDDAVEGFNFTPRPWYSLS